MLAAAVLSVNAALAPQMWDAAENVNVTAKAAENLTIADLPEDYEKAADWIWENRVMAEGSTGSEKKRYNLIFDQIVDGKGTLNYVVRWHSTKTITLEQRQKLEKVLDDSVNMWTDWLVGYEDWPYAHVDVNIVGWAVTNPALLLDLQADEIVYTDTTAYVIQPGENPNIPTVMANAPTELSRFDHFFDENYEYPGGLEKRFDMYLWATEGFPDIGGCGGDWGQRLSDTAYLNMLDGNGVHVHVHEVGHGFGLTDFYGGEGESDGFPPGGFPGTNTSIMMAGSSAEITDFDGWFFRYMWSKIKDESGRFDLGNSVPDVTTTTTATTTTTTTTTTMTSTQTEPAGEIRELPIFSSDDRRTWTIQVEDAWKVIAEAKALPYAALSGTYSYTNRATGENIEEGFMFPESLGDAGSGKFEITFPSGAEVEEVVITVDYYAQWDNSIGDMADQSTESLSFTAAGMAPIGTETTTTTMTEPMPMADGDVNDDGTLNLLDAVMLQKWLVCSGELTDRNAADLCTDGRINIYDLIWMKNLLLR